MSISTIKGFKDGTLIITQADVPFESQIVSINGDTVEHWQDVLEAVLDPKSERLRFDFASTSQAASTRQLSTSQG